MKRTTAICLMPPLQTKRTLYFQLGPSKRGKNLINDIYISINLCLFFASFHFASAFIVNVNFARFASESLVKNS